MEIRGAIAPLWRSQEPSRGRPPSLRALSDLPVDGQPRSNRDERAIAIEAAEYLKYKHPHAEVTVLDLVTCDTITIKALPLDRAP
jgi:hypothetical protein